MKINKKIRWIIAGMLLLFAVSINLRIQLHPSLEFSTVLLAQDSEGGENSSEHVCRCKNTDEGKGCFSGNSISFRAKCAANVESCSSYGHNCPN